MQRLFIFVLCYGVLYISLNNALRVRREKGNMLKPRTETAEKAQIANYSTSPVEAFFGTGAHTHSLPLNSNNGPSPVGSGITVGGMQINNDIQLQQTQVQHKHAVAGTNAMGENMSMNWNQHMHDYRNQTVATANAQGINPHPHYLGPNHFFGRSPFEHDTDLSGAPALSPTSGTHNIAGLNIGHSVQPSYATYTEAHNLPGVNPFGKGVNWTDHFSQVLPHHANQAGQSATVTGTAVKVVNPNLQSAIPQGQGGPGAQTSNVVQPATSQSNPFANPAGLPSQQQPSAAQALPSSSSTNPFLSRWR